MMTATHSLLVANGTLLVPVAINSIHDFGTQGNLKQIYWSILKLQGGPV